MGKPIVIELCAYDVASCGMAERAGAGRIELCADPLQGGTTPSYGTIKEARAKTSILLYPIIRPRGGNFLYTLDEIEVIKADILACKQLGCDGVVTGVQLPDGSLDIATMQILAEIAHPMHIACHRVFDLVPDPHKAMEELISIGYERILTSGQQKNALTGAPLIKQLIQQARDRITIMPGGGVRSTNIAELANTTGAIEFHTSARIASQDHTQNDNVLSLGDIITADENELQQMISISKSL